MKQTREYHAIGAILRIAGTRCLVIPKWCPMIHNEVTRSQAAECLRNLRKDRVKLRRIQRTT